MRNKQTLLITSLILIAAISRFFTPWPNVTPLGAIALLGGSYFHRKWLVFLIPLAALWLSNLVLNNIVYSNYYESFVWFGMDFWAVALAMVFIGLLGSFMLKKRTPSNLIASSIIASAMFFIVTNFGVWLQGVMYPMTFSGLVAAYTAAIPFFWNTIVGDFAFVIILFGIAELVLNRQVVFEAK